jgi:hypothetical protein
MQYRIGEKLKPGELEFSLSNVKQEMANSIEYEIKRKNVDTAKKLACKQLVNYDQFEELVRGANLKTVKTNEMSDLFTDAVSSKHNLTLKNIEGIVNYGTNSSYVTKYGDPLGIPDADADKKNYERKPKKVKEEIPIDDAQNFREYKKLFDQMYNDKNKSKENLQALLAYFIFNREIGGIWG